MSGPSGLIKVDIIAVNNINKTAVIAEVKRNEKNISLQDLTVKSSTLKPELSKYKIVFQGLSLKDM
jgi:hypothetical protein